MSHEARRAALGLVLPPAPKAVGIYRPLVVHGGLAYVSGHGPLRHDKTLVTGKVGVDLSVEEGVAAARLVGLGILATLRKHLGDLDRIERVLRVLGFVHCAPDFTEQPRVIDGCSALLAEVFGEEAGLGARSAVGMTALPSGIAVEIEAVFALRA